MFYFNYEAAIQKEYNVLLIRASSKDPSTEELRAIITDLIELDKKILPAHINSRLHFKIKELAFSLVYSQRKIPEKLPAEYRLSDSKLLEGYQQLKEHPGFAELDKKEAIYKKINRYIKNLEKAVASNPVVNPELPIIGNPAA